GGLSVNDQVAIYDPGSNTWSPGAPLPGPVSKRRSHAATALPDGRLVVIGGICDYECAILSDYEAQNNGVFYQPDVGAGSWTKTSAPMALFPEGVSATLLESDNVLVVGGNASQELCLIQGCACNIAAECNTGHCTDGVCCDSDCLGTCNACSAVLKGQ